MTSEINSDESIDLTDISEATLYHIMSSNRIAEGGRVLIEVQGQEIAIFRVNDDYYAVQNHCIHQGGPMCEGEAMCPSYMKSTMTDSGWELDQEQDIPTIACPWHGWEYSLETGKHVAPTEYTLRTYPLVIDEEEIYIKI